MATLAAGRASGETVAPDPRTVSAWYPSAPGSRVDLEAGGRQRENPVLRDAATRIEPLLDGTVPSQRIVRDFDDQSRTGGVGVAIVAGVAFDHGDVGLGLGAVVEGQRQLRAHVVAGAEHAPQGILDKAHRRRMPATLRSHREECSIDQLDPCLRSEHAGRDGAVVLDAAPVTGWKGCFGHGSLDRSSLR